MTEEEKPKGRIVSLGTGGPPTIKPEDASERLEEMIRLANLMAPDNDQNGTGKKNNSKETRARRRAQKLARKKNRYN